MAKLLLPISGRLVEGGVDITDDGCKTQDYPELTEDDLDDTSDEELSSITNSWVVRKTFLELTSNESSTPRMRSCRSEPYKSRVSLSASRIDEPIYISDATCSTCESSAEEADSVVRAVKFRAAEVQELSNTDSQADVGRVQAVKNQMRRTRTDSHVSILSVKTGDTPTWRTRADSQVSLMSSRTVDSPMYRTRADSRCKMANTPKRRARIDSKESILSLKTDYSTYAEDRFAFGIDQSPRHVSTNHIGTVPPMSPCLVTMSAIAPIMTAPVMLNPCALPIPAAKQVMTAPPGNFSRPPGEFTPNGVVSKPPGEFTPPGNFSRPPGEFTPPGNFSRHSGEVRSVTESAEQQEEPQEQKITAPPGNFSRPPGDFRSTAECMEQQEELAELQAQQRMLQEQRARLLTLSSGRSGEQIRNTQSLQQPPGQWIQRNEEASQFPAKEGLDGPYIGHVKSWNDLKKWGFLECAESRAVYGKDILLPWSSLGAPPEVGGSYTFYVKDGKTGPIAVKLKPQFMSDKDVNRCIRQRSQTEVKPHERTTVIIRHLPEDFSRDKIEKLLDSQGLASKYDFIYAPVKFGNVENIGYAFVNFISAEAAEKCFMTLDGFVGWSEPSDTACEVIWCEKDQGLAAIIDRHRNSPVMHPSVNDDFKPALYKNGVRVDFPAPTKSIRPPRVQRYRNEGTFADDESADP